MTTLTREQRKAVRQLLRFGDKIQTLGGYAGTGKTTVIKHLVEELPDFAVCAYTGKAANVLRRKGVRASTIHSLIYDVSEVQDSKGRRVLVSDLKPPEDIDCAGIIVDEASMVGREIYDDLTSLDLPLIFVGDHGQLEPVSGGDFNLMNDPDIVLNEIHRNAGEIGLFRRIGVLPLADEFKACGME